MRGLSPRVTALDRANQGIYAGFYLAGVALARIIHRVRR